LVLFRCWLGGGDHHLWRNLHDHVYALKAASVGGLFHFVPLPTAAEIHAWLALERQVRNCVTCSPSTGGGYLRAMTPLARRGADTDRRYGGGGRSRRGPLRQGKHKAALIWELPIFVHWSN
jgi:hypothetical protein